MDTYVAMVTPDAEIDQIIIIYYRRKLALLRLRYSIAISHLGSGSMALS